MSDDDSGELPEEHYDTFFHYDREYHQVSVDGNVYFGPVDQDEWQRLDLMHQVVMMMFEERLILPEQKIPNLRRVLDCGTGTASWAVDVARQYPRCEVQAIDVSPLMMPLADNRPSNLYLNQCDLNDSIPYGDNHFDFVHSRMVAGGINNTRWNGYLREIKRVLRPAGWCQMTEIYLNAQSDNGNLTDEHALRRWSARYLRAMGRLKNPRVGSHLKNLLETAGFVEVEIYSFNLPMCAWSSDEQEFQLGACNEENVSGLLYSLALLPLTAQEGMPIEEFNALVEEARAEARNPALKPYFKVYVAVGRKRRR